MQWDDPADTWDRNTFLTKLQGQNWHPIGSGGHIKEPKRVMFEPKDLTKFSWLGFGIAWDLSLFPSFLFLSLQLECLFYACSIIVFF